MKLSDAELSEVRAGRGHRAAVWVTRWNLVAFLALIGLTLAGARPVPQDLAFLVCAAGALVAFALAARVAAKFTSPSGWRSPAVRQVMEQLLREGFWLRPSSAERRR